MSIKDGRMPISKKYSTILYVKCYVCNIPLGTKDGRGVYGVSHGLCRNCFEKERAKANKVSYREAVVVF